MKNVTDISAHGMAFWDTYVSEQKKAELNSLIQALMAGEPFGNPEGRPLGAPPPPAADAGALHAVVAAMEALGASDLSAAAALGAHEVCTKAIELFGDEDQKRRWLAPLLSREKTGAYAISEPDAGSDTAMISSSVRLGGNDYILNGRKSFVTNGSNADLVLVFAVGAGTPDDPAHGDAEKSRLTAFIVSAGKKGIIKEPVSSMMGLSDAGVSHFHFEDCRVGRGDQLGGIGNGYQVAQAALAFGRLSAAAACLGAAKASYERALARAKERRQFGKPLVEFDMISEKFVAMTEQIFAMESSVGLVTSLAERGKDFAAESAIAKVFCSEASWSIADDALQIAGGFGYADKAYEETLRDLRGFRLLGGANEVLRLFIALYGGKPILQFLVDNRKARKSAGFFDAAVKLRLKRWKLALFRPKRLRVDRSLSHAAGIFSECAGILAERTFQVFEYYGEEVAQHEHELRRLADMAIEVFILNAELVRSSAILKGDIPDDKTLAVSATNYRAGKIARRIARWSSEIFVSEEGDRAMDEFVRARSGAPI